MTREKRTYRMKKRAELQERTRSRIVESTAELHRTIGPARTSISAVARRAGVRRSTIYRHFPDETALLSACSAHWRALHPAPDPAAWLATVDPGERLRLGLRELYAWYRETEPMTANILRDAAIVPALRPLVERGLGGYFEDVRRILTEPIRVRGRRRTHVQAAIGHALAFSTWRSLTRDNGLGDPEAADLMHQFVASL